MQRAASTQQIEISGVAVKAMKGENGSSLPVS